MLSEKVSVDEILFVGDSPEDQQAARSLGIHFIGRKSDRKLNSVSHTVYPDFIKIKNHLNQHYEF